MQIYFFFFFKKKNIVIKIKKFRKYKASPFGMIIYGYLIFRRGYVITEYLVIIKRNHVLFIIKNLVFNTMK
jgi:hypothetical protein